MIDAGTSTALKLSLAMLAVLAVASTTGAILKARVAQGQPHPAIDNLNARIRTWWIIAVVTGLALAAGPVGVVGLFLAASAIALREFTSALPARPGLRVALAGCLCIVLAVQYLLVWFDAVALYSLFIPACALALLAIGAFGVGVSRDRAEITTRVPVMLALALLLCVFCISHVPALLWARIDGYEGRNVFLIVWLLMVVQASDVLQYIWGKLAGRHRIAPRLSPSKTIEGTVGGILTATLLGTLLAPITPFSAGQSAVIALAIASLGFGGGLLMSAIKRRRGIKDWGTLFAGHGGMLDRIDSLSLSAPVFLHIVRVGWSP